jgi:hypothetical protein
MNVPGLVDRGLAVLAMLVSIRPLLRGALGGRSHVSWKRGVVLVGAGLAALVGVVGLLALRARLLDDPFFLPTWFGGTLAWFGGMLGVAMLIASRPPEGLSEDTAIRYATQAAAMCLYVAAPQLTLVLLGLTRLLRASLPWTVSERRWLRLVEGLALLALSAVPREPTLGGLRQAVASLGAL